MVNILIQAKGGDTLRDDEILITESIDGYTFYYINQINDILKGCSPSFKATILDRYDKIKPKKQITSIGTELLIREDCLKEHIKKSRYFYIYKIGRQLNVESNFYREYTHLLPIMEHFSQYKWIRQYRVNKPKRNINGTIYNNGYYPVDLYSPSLNLVIECDEHGHKYNSKELECKRENYIRTTLDCNIIRFNPDKKGFSIEEVINEINDHIKKRKGDLHGRG